MCVCFAVGLSHFLIVTIVNNELMLTLWGLFCLLQAYTSQFVALIMFALLMCDDRISMQPRRREIIQGLKVLPGKYI